MVRSLAERIHKKLIAGTLIPGIIIVLLFSFFAAYKKNSEERETSTLFATTLSVRVQDYVNHASNTLFKEGQLFEQLFLKKDISTISSLARYDLHFERIIILDKDFKILLSEPRGLIGTDFPFEIKQQGKNILSSPIVSSESQNLVILIRHKLKSGRWIAGELNLSFLTEEIRDITRNRDVRVVIVDPFGNAIAHPNINKVFERENIGNSELFQLTKQQKKSDFVEFEGINQFVTYQPIESFNWHLFVMRPGKHVVLSMLLSSGMFGLLMMLIVIFLLLLVRYQLTSLIVNPLSRFTEQVEKFTKDRNQGFSDASDDLVEIRILKNALESMSLSLSNRESSLIETKESVERALKTKTDFMANISHEIRTPLNIILGNAEMIESRLPPSETHQFSAVKTIKNSTVDLLRILNDILDQSKLEADKLDIQLQAVDPFNLIKQVCFTYNEVCQKKNLGFKCKVENLPGKIWVDEVRIKQVLLNLLDNAVKFTQKGEIELNILRKDVGLDKMNLVFCIKDTGMGISESEKNLVFEPFHQQGGKVNRKFGGTGLGLSIVKRLLALMDGTIEMESVQGKGSEFRVRLKNIKVDFHSISHERAEFEKMFSSYIEDEANDSKIVWPEAMLKEMPEYVVPVVRRLMKALSMEEVKRLAKVIKNYGDIHQLTVLSELSDRLYAAVELFDLEIIHEEFDRLLNWFDDSE